MSYSIAVGAATYILLKLFVSKGILSPSGSCHPRHQHQTMRMFRLHNMEWDPTGGVRLEVLVPRVDVTKRESPYMIPSFSSSFKLIPNFNLPELIMGTKPRRLMLPLQEKLCGR